MPDYCAAVTDSLDGRGEWRLIEDKAQALTYDDQGRAIFITSLDDLRFELEKRFPAPEHCAIVLPYATGEFRDIRVSHNSHVISVVRIPYASPKLELGATLQLVKDNPEGINVYWKVLGLRDQYTHCTGTVLEAGRDYIVDGSLGNGWYHIIHNPRRAKRILGAGRSAMKRRLSQGIWPFYSEQRFFESWRAWLLKEVPEINTVFQSKYCYQTPRGRDTNHDAFVMIKTVTQRLRLMEKARKQAFFKKEIRVAAQYLPGMMHKKDYHKGIIELVKAEMKAAGRVVPKAIPKKELQ